MAADTPGLPLLFTSHSSPILWFRFVFISNFARFLSWQFTCSPNHVSCSPLETPLCKVPLWGLSRILCHPVSYCSTLSSRPTCMHFSMCELDCRMTFTPAHVCAFLGCSRFLCKCTHVVSILPPPRHPIHSQPQDTLSLGANRPLSLSRLPLSPTLPWSIMFPMRRL